VRDDALLPHRLQALDLDQPSEGMEGAPDFESTNSLQILTFKENINLGIRD
jgi:hypothetical protein